MILRTAATEPNASHDGPNTYGHPHTRTFFRRGKDPTVNPVLAATVLQLMIISAVENKRMFHAVRDTTKKL